MRVIRRSTACKASLSDDTGGICAPEDEVTGLLIETTGAEMIETDFRLGGRSSAQLLFTVRGGSVLSAWLAIMSGTGSRMMVARDVCEESKHVHAELLSER